MPSSIGSMLYEIFDNTGLLKGSRPSHQRIAASSVTELLDIAAQTAEVTTISDAPRSVGVFEHSATLALGGWPTPCSAVACRVQHILGLGQFAALYSDRVYIPNFFMDHAAHWDASVHSEDQLRSRFADDLAVLGTIRPLVESGRIVPVTPPNSRCPRCFAEYDRSNAEKEQVEVTRRMLMDAFFDGTEFELFEDFDGLVVRYSGPEELFEHPGFRPLPDWAVDVVKNMPRIHQRLLEGERLKPSKTLRKKLKLHDIFAFEVLRDVMFELALARVLGTAFLADRQIQVSALNSLSATHELTDRNAIVGRHLTAMVPFITDLDPADLLRLREREEEAFLLFRRALNTAIEEVQASSTSFSSQHARQLYSDVLEPRLAELDRRLREGRKGLAVSGAGFVGSWTAAISFGLLSGVIPSNITGIAAALGIATVHKGTEALITRTENTEAELRSNDLYFLWCVKKLVST